MQEFVIETDALCLQYPRTLALDHLSLRIAKGGIHAFIGANGAGKSSLFRVLLGFDAPTGGSARILGSDSRNLPADLRGRIGFVNEEHTLPPWMRVGEVTAMQRRLYPRWDEERYVDVLQNFRVFPEQKIAQLSRGERAGVSLALALGQNPELLILDEPTLGLDVVAKRIFLESLMFSRDSDSGSAATIIYCSHQMEEIERIADRLVILERGRLSHMSTPDEFCARVRLWIADFAGPEPDPAQLPGLLQRQAIDGLQHYIMFDQPEDFDVRLRLLGARSASSMPVSLDRAVNAFLTRAHVSSQHQPKGATLTRDEPQHA